MLQAIASVHGNCAASRDDSRWLRHEAFRSGSATGVANLGSSRSHFAPHILLDVAALDRLALVVRLASARETDFELHAPALEVRLQRNQRQTFLGDLAAELQDVLLVQQELSLPFFRMIHPVAVRI